MKQTKKQRLERAGWTVGNAQQFLGLSEDERRFIETKLALAAGIRRRREKHQVTQAELARRLGSSQSRIAKMEAADPSVSLDLMMRSLYRLGASQEDVARIIRQATRPTAA
jgi:DNA-binding XRE family transcriptional regulator